MLGIIATLMLGCSGTETATPEPAPEPEPAVEPEPEPEPEPAMDEELTPDGLNADRDAHVGQSVKVKGFYSNMTKQDSPPQINVSIYEDAELAGGSVLCVFDVAKEADISALVEKSKLLVSGTVSEEKFLDKAKLDGCQIEKSAAPGEGKEGKEDGAKAGKGGKGGKGKQKAH